MSLQVSEEEIYEDISTIMQFLKQKLKHILQKRQQQMNQLQGNEQILNEKIDQLISKYKRTMIHSKEMFKILARFLMRIKQTTQQFCIFIPKNQIHNMLIMKTLDTFSCKIVSGQNFSLLIVSIMTIIKQLSKNPANSLKIKKQKIEISQNSRPHGQNLKKKMVQKNGQKRLSQTEILYKSIQMYKDIDLDKQFLRAKYFDLKANKQEDSINEMLLRNRFTRYSLNEFKKQHDKYLARGPKKFSFRSQTRNIQTQRGKRNEYFKDFQERQSVKTTRLNKTLQNFKPKQESRSQMFESYFKNSTINAKTIVKGRQFTLQYNLKTIGSKRDRQIEVKRKEFFKKSQQQIRYKYRYIQRKQKKQEFRQNYLKENPEKNYTTIYYS